MHNVIQKYINDGDKTSLKETINCLSYVELGLIIKDTISFPETNNRFIEARNYICIKGFKDLVNKILVLSSDKEINKEKEPFKFRTNEITKFIDELDLEVFKQIVKHIGTIPENISHDSTEEKLYSKASDIVLSRCFRELGLRSKALDERGNSADVIAESISGYGYSLVADAKCFRMSRTAKNQKDFKINALSEWRGSENDYAVLVSPYYQYPTKKSQIYSDALNKEVCLLSWEHMYIFLKYGLKETEESPIENIWKTSQFIARDKTLAYSSRENCFLHKINKLLAKKLSIPEKQFEEELDLFKKFISARGDDEIQYWENEIAEIKSYSKEKAIDELLKAKKLTEKISAIKKYLKTLE